MSTKVYTREEVAKHNSKENGWFIIGNNVYNVSDFYDDHPGGRDVLLYQIGGDATEAFEAVNHSRGAQEMMKGMKVGSLSSDASETKLMRLSELVVIQKEKSAEKSTACWVIIENKVYDLTTFLDLHPGGRDVLLCTAGTDATKAFNDIGHSKGAQKMMQPYQIAELHPDDRIKTNSTRSNENKSTNNTVNNNNNTVKKPDTSLYEFVMGQVKVVLMILVVLFAILYVIL